MKRVFFVVLLTFLPLMLIAQGSLQPWHQRTGFAHTSPSAMNYGHFGFDNPGNLAFVDDFDVLFQWSDRDGFTEFNHWGLFTAAENIGFGMVRYHNGGDNFMSYRISTAHGNDTAGFGFSYNWFDGTTDFENSLSAGMAVRFSKYLAFGIAGSRTISGDDYEGYADVAFRPFGNPLLSVFGDIGYGVSEGSGQVNFSGGVAFEPAAGIRITGRFFDNNTLTAGVQISFGNSGISTQTYLDNGITHNVYGIRLGTYDRSIIDQNLRKNDNYMNLNLRGPMAYQTREFFDKRNQLHRTLTNIRNAKEDPTVSGIVINTTGMSMSNAMVWEIRDELESFKADGKKVIMYVERGGMATFHLASVADYVVMDPLGGMTLPGYASGTTYLKDLLDSAGIGVDEFREMTHKSAFESFARSERSPEDQQQREDLINGYYELTRNDVMRSQDISEEDYEALIDRGIFLLPEDLLSIGFVDTLARPGDLNDIIEKLEGESRKRIGADDLLASKKQKDEYWGVKPKIALLYAIGGTQTEGGIRARTLANSIRNAAGDDNVKAIVMRADSPGGDALASDLVAEELRKASESKPVIVSMGAVAASGGYWISMYADTIVAVPNTVTGSIGVISGWFYDDGLSEKMNLNYSSISRGKSADLFTGPTLPLIGLQLPGRNLTEDEREGLIDRMLTLYDLFIDKVAEGRDSDYDTIKEVAEGRVWTGLQAKENGLVDEIGNLLFAVDIALEKAGLSWGEPFELTEGPSLSRFDIFDILPIPSFFRSRFASQDATENDPVTDYLKLMMEHNGQPMISLPMDMYEFIYRMEK